MFNRGFILSGMVVLIIISMLNVPVLAITGDCDNNGSVSSTDAVEVINWLFSNGDLPNMPDCDCDGFPGLNLGDALQIIDYAFIGANLYGYPSYDIPVPSLVKFYYNEPVPENTTNFILDIYIDVPPGFDISSYILAFSFAQQQGTQQAPLICNSVDFTGTVANFTGSSTINNANDYFIIEYSSMSTTPAISGGSNGLLCSVDFTSGAGTPNPIIMTSVDNVWPMLFAQNAYAGVNGERVFLPAAIRAPYGDVNSDGLVNISDAVYIINWVFIPGSPAPGEGEPPE